MQNPEVKFQDTARLKCAQCGAICIFEVQSVNGRLATEFELWEQARTLGWLFNLKRNQFCSELCADAWLQAYYAAEPTPAPEQPLPPLTAVQERLI